MASRRPTDSPRNSRVATPNVATPGATTPGAAPTSEKPPSIAKAPAARRPRAKKTAAAAASPRLEISEDVRRGMIAEAAYLRAERRGFVGGDEREDWLAAEAEVDALLRAGHGSSPQ